MNERRRLRKDTAIDAPDGAASQTMVGPDSIVVMEKWADLAALHAHAASPHTAADAARVQHLIAARIITY